MTPDEHPLVGVLWFDGALTQDEADLVKEAFNVLSRLPARLRLALVRAVANAEHIDGPDAISEAGDG